MSAYKMPGRPARSPLNKMGISIRCMVTMGVNDAVVAGADASGVIVSDYLRLALYNQLRIDGLLKDLTEDSTFDTLRGFGLVSVNRVNLPRIQE